MSLPSYDQFIEPILRYLAAHPEGAYARSVHEAVADALRLSDAQRQEVIGSGQLVYKNRAGWAHDRLKRAGFSSSVRRGYWQLTDEGVVYAANHLAPLANDEVERIAMQYIGTVLHSAPDAVTLEISDGPLMIMESPTESPDDRLDSAIAELRASAASDLLDSLLRVSPDRFEIIVLDVLLQLGYGASRSDIQKVGGSGDGGIDGIISLDKLGLEKVYVQAKRWQATVGRPELQAFYGALAGQKAKRGVFITTSGFTVQAADFAKSVEGIVLIDGPKLVGLMIDNEVGVTSRILRLPRIDTDYFDEEA